MDISPQPSILVFYTYGKNRRKLEGALPYLKALASGSDFRVYVTVSSLDEVFWDARTGIRALVLSTPERYENLPLKTWEILSKFEGDDFKFLFKVDDDVELYPDVLRRINRSEKSRYLAYKAFFRDQTFGPELYHLGKTGNIQPFSYNRNSSDCCDSFYYAGGSIYGISRDALLVFLSRTSPEVIVSDRNEKNVRGLYEDLMLGELLARSGYSPKSALPVFRASFTGVVKSLRVLWNSLVHTFYSNPVSVNDSCILGVIVEVPNLRSAFFSKVIGMIAFFANRPR